MIEVIIPAASAVIMLVVAYYTTREHLLLLESKKEYEKLVAQSEQDYIEVKKLLLLHEQRFAEGAKKDTNDSWTN